METKNAVITSASLTTGDRGILGCWLGLDYGGTGQGFGCYALYLPKVFDHHSVLSPAGHFICRVMEVAGVTQWDDIIGKTIRVKADHAGVESIGHIAKDDWFTPSQDLDTPEAPNPAAEGGAQHLPSSQSLGRVETEDTHA